MMERQLPYFLTRSMLFLWCIKDDSPWRLTESSFPPWMLQMDRHGLLIAMISSIPANNGDHPCQLHFFKGGRVKL